MERAVRVFLEIFAVVVKVVYNRRQTAVHRGASAVRVIFMPAVIALYMSVAVLDLVGLAAFAARAVADKSGIRACTDNACPAVEYDVSAAVLGRADKCRRAVA